MPEGSWKIHLKHGQVEIEVVGATREETLKLFEEIAQKLKEGGTAIGYGKPKY